MLRNALHTALFSGLVGLSVLACSAEAADKVPVIEGPVRNHIEMIVTDQGFEPQNVRVKQGEPVTLEITRKVDATCATEIVIDEYGINTKLPLDTKVTVTFTPKKSGVLKYGCAMQKMIGGILKVE